MSNKKFKNSQGQRGPSMQLHYDELSKLERAIVDVLADSNKRSLTITEIMEANNWHKIKGGRARGNSRVRNTLRRIVRAEWVGHPDATGDGTYRLTAKGRARLRRLNSAQSSKQAAMAKAA